MTCRVLIAVTHLLGVGHLTRAAAIARALAAGGMRVTLVSGGRATSLIGAGQAHIVQLAPVHIEGTAFSRLLQPDGRPADDAYLAGRRDALLSAFEEAAPDVVITELFPFGRRALAGEFLALAEAAHAAPRRPAILASVRDILVRPEKPTRIAEAHARLAALYDGVLVHGDEALVPLDASWPVDAALRPLLHYTGYVDEAQDAAASPMTAGAILVSGGGGAAARPVIEAALGAARLDPTRRWHCLVGKPLDAQLRETAPPNALVEPTRPDFQSLLAGCHVSVSRAGYNTMLDLARAGCRSVVVPFEDDRETEQRVRAECFARHGLVTLLPEADLSPRTLLDAIDRAVAQGGPTAAGFRRDGLARTLALVRRFAERRPA